MAMPTMTMPTIALRARCDALFCPSVNVMVFDHRPNEGAEGSPERDDPCIGTPPHPAPTPALTVA